MSEPHTTTALLSVESLSRLHVRASFKLNSGECIALQEASGSGKTVLNAGDRRSRPERGHRQARWRLTRERAWSDVAKAGHVSRRRTRLVGGHRPRAFHE